MEPIKGVMGIDLGTTYCCVAVMKGGQAKAVANNEGNYTTSSCVNFNEDTILVGEKDRLKGITIYDQKRLIGRKFEDPEIQKRLKYWSFNVINKNGKPAVIVSGKDNVKHYFPEEISAKILTYLKESASNFMGFEIKHAVVTVPAYFNISQREATKDACRIAGLNVLRIINEPTAAAYAIYGAEKLREDSYNILMYDLGGGTFDVSILRVDHAALKVLATRGDNNLGGEDFNNNLFQYFADDIKSKHSVDIFEKPDNKLKRRLQNACEKVKKNLSQQMTATVDLAAITEDDYSGQITRAKFEELNRDLFWKTLDVIKLCLADAKLTEKDIEVVVLVGGSTRIPYVQTILKDFFKREGGIQLKTSQNPDETIAVGAATYASKLMAVSNALRPPIEKDLFDVTPLSLGIEVAGGKMSVIISRNTPIPTSIKKIYSNHDFQTMLKITVYQGECSLVKDNYDLGSFTLLNLPMKPKGTLNIEVTFDVDANGVLAVSAVEVVSKVQNKLELKINGCLDEEEIQQMIEEAEILRQKERRDKEIEILQNELEEECRSVLNKLRNLTVTEDVRREVGGVCDRYLDDIKYKKLKDAGHLEKELNYLKSLCKKHTIVFTRNT